MSSNTTGTHSRPNLWQYVSFSSTRRRSSSLTLPKQREAHDPFEKPDRHSTHKSAESMQEKVQAALMNQGARARYIKTGCLIFFVLAVLYYIVPGQSIGAGKFPGGDVASDPSVATAKCSRSYSKDKPLIQYALMVDAGSTGSRIHVYRFNNCGPTPELEDEVFKMTEKREGGSGLSSYKGDAEGAAKSLDVLMDVAVKSVPDKLKGCTPVAVKATAGLRKLGPEMSDAILKAVRQRLETVYPFPVVSEANGGVEVMDGKDEGVYAWISTSASKNKVSFSRAPLQALRTKTVQHP